MLHDLLEAGSSGRVTGQNAGNEISRLVRDLHVVWEVVLVSFDARVSGFNVSRLERWLADDECVDNDAKRPDIDLVGVAYAALEHLGRDVVGCAADGALLLSLEVELGCQTKVTQLDHHFVVDEEVAELDVTVDDAVRVEEPQCTDHLAGVTLDLELVQALAPLQQLVETLVLAELEQNVDALAVLEKVLKLRNVLMLDRAVDFDLAHQLLLGAASLQ